VAYRMTSSTYNNRIVNLAMGVGGQAKAGQRRRAQTDDGRRPAAGGSSRRGRRRTSQNRDVTPGAWLTGVDGRTGR